MIENKIYKHINEIYEARKTAHGLPKECFGMIADFWDLYISKKKHKKITPKDVCILMALFKISREMLNKGDCIENMSDACNYLALISELNS